MTTKALAAFGMTVNLEESVIENGFALIGKLRIDRATPTECIDTLAKELKLTGAEAVAIYAEYQTRHKPLF